jgi:polyisoprenoid-binding protein YceI
MTYATTASGSPLPDYLTQTNIGVPLQTGVIREISGALYGYSGAINFDVTAAATYTMMRFTLDRTSVLTARFNIKHGKLGNAEFGYSVNVDGVDIMFWSSNNSAGKVLDVDPYPFLIPSQKEVIINLLNLGGEAYTNIDANVTLMGQYV